MTPREKMQQLIDLLGSNWRNLLTPAQIEEIDDLLEKRLWEPQPGNRPQLAAYQSKIDIVGYGGAAGGGKLGCVDIEVPTPTGWKRLGDIVSGDEILTEKGTPCVVMGAHPVVIPEECWRLTFDDGSFVDCGSEHLWLTFTAKDLAAIQRRTPEARLRKRQHRESQINGNRSLAQTASIVQRNQQRQHDYLPTPTGAVRTTAEIAATLRVGKSNRVNHAVPVSAPLELPQQELPLDPYLLGLWLGDGCRGYGQITTADEEVLDAFEAEGFAVRKNTAKYSWGIYKLVTVLREVGVLERKHVPQLYLRASKEQRLALLQGLMDSDGTTGEGGQAEFDNTNRQLAEAVHELIVSLGWKARIRTERAKLYGKDCGPKYRIKWMPDEYVFRITRKRLRQKLATRQVTRFRYIVSCERIQSKPMRCLTVDNPTSLFLWDRNMIPTHNSQVLLGKALTLHKRSLIVRKEAKDLQALIDACREIVGKQGSFNANLNIWRDLPGGRTIRFGGLKDPGDEQHYRGQPSDFIGFDEADQIPEYMVRFLIGWLRTTDKQQHCQVMICFNPPSDPEGEWLLRFFAPWLDSEHPHPAGPGEIRFFAMVHGKEQEFPNANPFKVDGHTIIPRSRTFFPASVGDNKSLADTGYLQTLLSLPSPLREQLAFGDFKAGRVDGAWQAIPTSWVKLAQKRWAPTPPFPGQMTALGVDVGMGGNDPTALAPLYKSEKLAWFDRVDTHRGLETNSGRKGAALAKAKHRHRAILNVDMNGWGVACCEHLEDDPDLQGLVRGIMVSEASEQKDRSGKFQMGNVRAALFWTLREALDPDLDDSRGWVVALPPDDDLAIELGMPIYRIVSGRILIEGKEEIKKRLKRSTDRADAVCLALWQTTGLGTIHTSGDKNKDWNLGVPAGGGRPLSDQMDDVEDSILLFGGDDRPDREERGWWENL